MGVGVRALVRPRVVDRWRTGERDDAGVRARARLRGAATGLRDAAGTAAVSGGGDPRVRGRDGRVSRRRLGRHRQRRDVPRADADGAAGPVPPPAARTPRRARASPAAHGLPMIRVVATTATDARQALLRRLIDHAALFPPASMAMADALEEDARIRASAEAWIVNRFVVPASRVGELGDVPLRLSVVLDSRLPDDERIEAVDVPPGVDPGSFVGVAPEVYVEVPFDGDQPGALERLAQRRPPAT